MNGSYGEPKRGLWFTSFGHTFRLPPRGPCQQREQDLTEKSNALTALSAKLAKYLAPQVYDSIFTGQQDVKIVSKRKKLTVCFSDLVGFTEITDKMESEDLTQLLNHYLTEMSKIALQFGATIDSWRCHCHVLRRSDNAGCERGRFGLR